MGVEHLESWKRLDNLATKTITTHLNQTVMTPNRFATMSLRVGKLLIDFSKQRATSKVVSTLVDLAKEASLEPAIENLFQGVEVNPTEGRAALHMALRAPPDMWPKNVANIIEDETSRFYEIVARIRSGHWRGIFGKPIKNIVHIGIGGSHLGPELACKALAGDQRFNIRFLTNIDGAAAIHTFAGFDPTETLIIVVSKSFSTLETLTNAHYARTWFLERTRDVDGISQHFIAVTANAASAQEFGIPARNCLPMWDWVGGRYSLWSAVGLPIALALGEKGFRSMLAGAHQMDRHFQNSQLENNAPVLLALYGIWNGNFLGAATHAVLVYHQRLATLTNYLQQLEMESNGKSTLIDGSPSKVNTSPVVWGGEETNGQHAFHQLLHQGTRSFSADFIAVAAPEHDLKEHHQWLLASCLSQSQAMLQGTDPSDLTDDPMRAHRAVCGDHSTTTILLDTLDPESFGALLALYEHKVFCQGVIWQINSFDQWGGELGKQLAKKVFDALNGESVQGLDPSTKGLINALRTH
jgi:glucose-6-phosphate isomerase